MCLTYILKKPTLEKTLGKTQKNPGFLGFFKILGFCPTLECATDRPTNGLTDGRADRQTDRLGFRDARTHLKRVETRARAA